MRRRAVGVAVIVTGMRRLAPSSLQMSQLYPR